MLSFRLGHDPSTPGGGGDSLKNPGTPGGGGPHTPSNLGADNNSQQQPPKYPGGGGPHTPTSEALFSGDHTPGGGPLPGTPHTPTSSSQQQQDSNKRAFPAPSPGPDGNPRFPMPGSPGGGRFPGGMSPNHMAMVGAGLPPQDNMPLNPATPTSATSVPSNHAGGGCKGGFDPITSMAQMSQQLTQVSTPCSTDARVEDSDSCVPGMIGTGLLV